MSQRIILNVKGLHCANCAAKIEKKLNEMQNVKEARIDLVGEKIFLTAEEKNGSVLVNAVQKIADSIEEGVKIFLPSKHNHAHSHDHAHDHSHHHSGEVGEMIKILVIGGIFYFAASYPNLFSAYLSPDTVTFAKIILFLISYIIIGGHVLTTAFKNILKGQFFDENFLMAVATIGAFAIGEYHEAVAVMFFYQVGELFQSMAVNKSRKSIASLMNIRPDYANLKVRNNITKVSPEEVKINDFIVVKPGEKVPLDGKITEGSSSFDTSALTG